MGKEEEKRQHLKQLVEASSLGWMFPLAIGIGYLAGSWIDRKLGTWPWFTGILAGCGIIAAFLNLFRMTIAEDKEPDDPSSGNG